MKGFLLRLTKMWWVYDKYYSHFSKPALKESLRPPTSVHVTKEFPNCLPVRS